LRACDVLADAGAGVGVGVDEQLHGLMRLNT
jgi:hypothetical protein